MVKPFDSHFAKNSALVAFTLVLAAIAVQPSTPLFRRQSAAAQSASPSFQVPPTLPENSRLRIAGSSSMAAITAALRNQFQAQFKNAEITAETQGTEAALKDLIEGKVDLVAISRPLTQAEKAQGLAEVPLTRHKIAIITSPNSPFKGDLTIDQFAKIFRGEITDWSQINPAMKGAVRLVDRPESSDTRQAFQQYPVFQAGPLTAAATARRVTEDSTDAVVKELGPDGLGYAIADQVLNRQDVRILSMYQTRPDNPQYPFSQPLGYAYQQNTTNPVVQAFLGYATSPQNAAVIEQARMTTATQATAPAPVAQAPASPAAPSPESSPAPAATTAPTPATLPTTDATVSSGSASPLAVASRESEGIPAWLWPLLGLPLLGGLLWWFLRDGGAVAPVATPVDEPIASRIILTPRDCRNAYAYWEVSAAAKAKLRQQGGRDLKLRLYDVTDIHLDEPFAHRIEQFEEFDVSDRDPDLHLPIPVDNRDYLVELGYTTRSGEWLPLCQSERVRVPACAPAGSAASGGAGIANGIAAATALVGSSVLAPERAFNPTQDSRIILVPRDSQSAYAYWEISTTEKEALKRSGGRDLRLRLYDVTGGIDIDQQAPLSVQEYDCSEVDPDMHLRINDSDRDYLVELGYISDDGRWLKIARSEAVRVASSSAFQSRDS